jgi:hypothetical protein
MAVRMAVRMAVPDPYLTPRYARCDFEETVVKCSDFVALFSSRISDSRAFPELAAAIEDTSASRW